MQNIPAYRWPPTHRLLAARFLANLEQLQNRDFAISNRSKPICVLTRTKSLYMLDSLPIGYHLPDFQLIWSNFKIEIFQLQTALNPYEFWRASFYPTSDDHLPIGNSLPDFQPNRSNFLAGLPLFHYQEEGGRHLGGLCPPKPFRGDGAIGTLTQ